jgi:hypothetical protein
MDKIKRVIILFAAWMPIILVLDYGMKINLVEDFGWGIAILYYSTLVFFAELYSFSKGVKQWTK